MIGCTRRHVTLIHIACVSEVFMTRYFIHNGCTFEGKGRVRKGGLTILMLVAFKVVK